MLPDDKNAEKEMFSYSGEALCYNPENNSLFITGHNWYTYIAEITIPQVDLSRDLSKLNKAQIIKDFTDIKGKIFNKWTMEIPRVGLEVANGKLFF